MEIRELIDRFIKAQAEFEKARLDLIAHMKEKKWKTFTIAPRKYIRLSEVSTYDRIAYFDKSLEKELPEVGTGE